MRSRTGAPPRFAVGAGYAMYRGLTTDSVPHRHAAFQIAIAGRDVVGIVDEAGAEHRDVVLVVPPMVWHRLLGHEDLLIFFVEPHCVFADRLRARCGPGITAAPELRELGEDEIARAGTHPSTELDPRLVRALAAVRTGTVPIPEVAAQVGLSPQRLRALARRELGMPLTRQRAWSRLRHAAQEMQSGLSPAEAAVAAGFADQAHLTRWMREMMGLTPAAVLPILRSQSRRAT
ncbi:helix-turn-helix domain-containing protein [Nocardia sp. NPDC003345]